MAASPLGPPGVSAAAAGTQGSGASAAGAGAEGTGADPEDLLPWATAAGSGGAAALVATKGGGGAPPGFAAPSRITEGYSSSQMPFEKRFSIPFLGPSKRRTFR